MSISSSSESNKDNMSMFCYFIKCFRDYFDCKGIASRKEYWSFILFQILLIFWLLIGVAVFMLFLEQNTNATTLTLMVSAIMLPTLVPSVTVTIRRMNALKKKWVLLLPLMIICGLSAIIPLTSYADSSLEWIVGIVSIITYLYYVIFFFSRKSISNAEITT